MNQIPQIQNTEVQLDRLAAQRRLYAASKRLLGLQMILVGPVAIGWAFVALHWPALKGVGALWGFIVFICDFIWLTPRQKTLRENAATVQEMFDCDVLELPWNRIKVGPRTAPELVHEYARKYYRHDRRSSTLRNWYPPAVGELPLAVARILCQRVNCWWDGNQRNRYALFIGAVAIAVCVAVIWIAALAGLTVENLFLMIVAPLMPVMVLMQRLWVDQRAAVARLTKLHQAADDLREKALSGAPAAELSAASRQLQDEIFQSRKSNPPVFDFLYALFQGETEVRMNRGAEELVAEAKQRLGLP